MTLLPITRAFLRDWLDWVERGAPHNQPYLRSIGLCGNAGRYEEGDHYLEIWSDLSNYFAAEYSELSYPFGEKDYDVRFASKSQHLNPDRLAFARAHCEQDHPTTNEEK